MQGKNFHIFSLNLEMYYRKKEIKENRKERRIEQRKISVGKEIKTEKKRCRKLVKK